MGATCVARWKSCGAAASEACPRCTLHRHSEQPLRMGLYWLRSLKRRLFRYLRLLPQTLRVFPAFIRIIAGGSRQVVAFPLALAHSGLRVAFLAIRFSSPRSGMARQAPMKKAKANCRCSVKGAGYMPTISSASSFVAEALFSPNVQDNEAAARRSERPQLSQDDVLKPTVTAPPCVRFVRQHSEPIYVCEARPG